MRALKLGLGLAALLALAFVIVGFFLPADFRVERRILINAPVQRIYPLLAEPRRWQQWSIWTRRDPTMAITYFGPPSGVGAGWRWDSKTEGRGEMTFLTADPATGLTYQLYFADYGSMSAGDLSLQAQGNATLVTWNNRGSVGNNPLRHYMAVTMDRIVGPDFAAGLANLKLIAEKP